VPARDAVGQPLEALLRQAQHRPLLELVRRAREDTRVAQQGQVQMKLAQGTRTLSVVASPLVGESERRPGTVVVFDDLTQILASQRLTAWKEAVERVIHEIKNPLTPVGLSAQTLLTAFEQDRRRFEQMFPSAVKIILDSVRDLKALIAEFTQFSRLPEAVLQRLDLNELVRAAVAPYATGAGVALRSELACEPLYVEADANQLRRVLLNVVNNAIEAMDGRTGEIVVSSAPSDARGQVSVSVRDQGRGVDDVERIFEPYYTTKIKGTGLGLAIARQIVAEHGGTICAESALEVGTTIVVRLPAAARPVSVTAVR
jgi:two-component system, NtrC family, nitrogen regulation sensor histidine kinase NtrY